MCPTQGSSGRGRRTDELAGRRSDDVRRVRRTFQNALAEASGLVRIAPMLEVLADHVRMFIAVMGLDYAYPIDAILREDRAIFEAIDSGDGEAAAERWRVKIDDAAAYMLGQLAAARSRAGGSP